MPTTSIPDPVAVTPSTDGSSLLRNLLVTAVVPAVLITLVLWFPLGWFAPLLGVALGLAIAWLLASRSDDAILALAGGTVATPETAARLVNVVEGLSLTAGIAVPEIRVRDEDTVNAMAAGRIGGETAVIVTRGLLDRLDRIALEGVVATLLVRLRSAEQEQRTLAATTTRLPTLIRERFLGARGPGPHDPGIETHLLIDREAVRMTRYPPGLLRALEIAVDAGTEIESAGPASSGFWLAPVNGDRSDLGVRIDALREL